eukprot:TRINITY_DN942_c0_g1_i1.p1 TRINITY_DN942_c0_g1~~TRINITY_DN942_c0_g1_i1.p1  ORF type:complete len:1559 (-),score=404.24 TRINITY_DN942_c0_g1_i1:474-5150(-)
MTLSLLLLASGRAALAESQIREDHAEHLHAFDCQAGLSNWRLGWSEAKKKWCCSHVGLGCDAVPTTSARTCQGSQTERGPCEELPGCEDCTPVNCEFAEWGDWENLKHCEGLKTRSRAIKVPNNECGQPCKGIKKETAEAPVPEECARVPSKDCVLSDWSMWTTCTTPSGQRSRTRHVEQEAVYLGMPCSGSLEETYPCAKEKPHDCQFSDWSAWHTCSQSCGGGWTSSTRRIIRLAGNGGKPCEGNTTIQKVCNEQSCSKENDCKFGAWSKWSSDCKGGQRQRYRSREIDRPVSGMGKPCDGDLHETDSCPLPSHKKPEPCELSGWSEWSDCDATCNGGQAFRTRTVVTEPVNGGGCPEDSLHEIKPCNEKPCEKARDCLFGRWSEWSDCSASCGNGIMTRSRDIDHLSKLLGKGCDGNLKEVAKCTKPACPSTDCEWGDWIEWSACTASCGGGTKRRDRLVEVPPRGFGHLCTAQAKEEIVACNTAQCGRSSVDGEWFPWASWTACSATCGDGFQSRHREVKTQPNLYGKPLKGVSDDFRKCSATPCETDQDCVLADWSAWADCSASCFGIKERSREIAHMKTGNGKPCSHGTLKEVLPCNSDGAALLDKCGGKQPRPCEVGDWSDWGHCSADCDGGQRIRTRSIQTPAMVGGETCKDVLSQLEECGTKACGKESCVDCAWGMWSDWSSCTKGGGQHFRHRSITQLNNVCGKPCVAADSKETDACKVDVSYDFCGWTEWTENGECSTLCGNGMKIRQRNLQLLPEPATKEEEAKVLFKNQDGMGACTGAQVAVDTCQNAPCGVQCHPVDGKFSEWSDWAAPTCTQLCERHRTVSVHSSCGGHVLVGPLVETKTCPHICRTPQDCVFGPWSDYSKCNEESWQETRTREVITFPANDGKACEGALESIRSCSKPPADETPCKYSAWQAWGMCSRTCGTGYRHRERTIAKTAKRGGDLCEGQLEELGTCSMSACPGPKKEDCEVGPWSAWSECENGQTYSRRQVLHEASDTGRGCSLVLKKVKSCDTKVDCVVSSWTAWDDCDRPCDGGQSNRHRQIDVFPKFGGKMCPAVMTMTKGCNMHPCGTPDKCKMSEWTKWSSCSATCGVGQESRTREMINQGCAGNLKETRPCAKLPSCEHITNCEWFDWTDWSSCSCPCDGGQRTRDRHIKKAPTRGGKPCLVSDKEQIEPCNTIKCGESCVDGEWGDWTEWEACTATCKGVTWRSRRVVREANECGKPAEGEAHETASCNDNVPCFPSIDCAFNDWSEWSDCTEECSGVKRRSRGIKTQARGAGKHCMGPLKESWPCNPSGPNEKVPGKCSDPPVDCVLGDWGQFTTCSATCGGGSHTRTREIVRQPTNGGRGCNGALSVILPCNESPCDTGCQAQDCKWGEWSDWGGCSKCAGQRNRFRHILQHAKCGGQACAAAAALETSKCPRFCHADSYCAWAPWGEWGSCDAACGEGTRTRSRDMTALSGKSLKGEEKFVAKGLSNLDEMDLAEKLSALLQRTQAQEAHRFQEVAVAFAAGGVSLVALLFVMRLCSSRRPVSAGTLQVSQMQFVE